MISIQLLIKLYFLCAEWCNGGEFYYKDVKKETGTLNVQYFVEDYLS